MRAGIYYIFSDLHEQSKLKKAKEDYFSAVSAKMPIFEMKDHDFFAYDLIFISILTGGTENKFAQIWSELKNSGKPFVLVAFNSDNSLPAAMEIQSWLNVSCNYSGSSIIHGNCERIAEQLMEMANLQNLTFQLQRETLGIIGEPSDWLIASKANYAAMEKKLGIRFTQIPMNEFRNVIESLKEKGSKTFEDSFASFKTSQNEEEFQKAEKIYLALKKTLRNYCLTSLTIRCFDILEADNTTGCLALSLLNDEGITAGCEGDVPAAISMLIARVATQKPAFMANPSRVEKDEVVFAHCTAPYSMLKYFKIDSHFESGIGLAISGDFAPGPVTLFKIDGEASSYALAEGEILAFSREENLCRTQIKASFSGAKEYMLQRPLGNHQILILGHHAKKIGSFCDLKGMKPVW